MESTQIRSLASLWVEKRSPESCWEVLHVRRKKFTTVYKLKFYIMIQLVLTFKNLSSSSAFGIPIDSNL